ncbi:5' nucleotidase A isoform X1 [Lasioglossum baleicum]|uniref:5' nucleotidase A isoform X1 n=1 Tax=Lasioglossum baleicum TaxID=434251 RepID=UPI003FCCAECF
MIRALHSVYAPLQFNFEQVFINFNRTAVKSHRFSCLLTSVATVKHFCTTMSDFSAVQVNTNKLKILDYDCIGFDLDNALIRYNVTNMGQMVYEILADYLIMEKRYSSKHLSKPLKDKDLDFMQKGLLLDFERGNLLRINPEGIIQRACHGTNLLSTTEIKEIYPNQRWEVTDTFCRDILSTWQGPTSMKMRSLLDYFDISTSLIFARLIDTIDEEEGGSVNTYNVWPDMLDGLINMYHRDHFKLTKGNFFANIKEDQDKYLRKCSAKTISWLKELKKHRTTFLITGSYIDFVESIATYALGNDWKSLFDIVICYARKPGFFTKDEPFLQIIDNIEGEIVESKDLIQGGIYSQGNWKGLVQFLGRVSDKSNPCCIYFGDNLIQDIYTPSVHAQCDTVAVVEEQMSEGMVHQGLSHPDEKILNSTFWGSYFCLRDSNTSMDSLWGSVIKKHAKLCIPEIDVIAEQPLEKSYLCFSASGMKYDGYYPAKPLSVSTF